MGQRGQKRTYQTRVAWRSGDVRAGHPCPLWVQSRHGQSRSACPASAPDPTSRQVSADDLASVIMVSAACWDIARAR
jgi:hypothetical protein